MAGKYWWEDDDQKKQQGSGQASSQDTKSQGYWWENGSVATTVGTNLTNRVNTWLKNHNNYISNHQNRYSNRKYNYEDAYVSDSASWLDTVSKQKSELDTESDNIMAYIRQYKDYIDTDTMKSVWDTLAGASDTQRQILDSATKDNEYWSKFAPNEEQKAAGYTSDKLYEMWQTEQKQYAEDEAYDVEAGLLELEKLKKERDEYLAAKKAERKQAENDESFWDSLGRWLGNTPDTTIPLAGVSSNNGSTNPAEAYDRKIAALEEKIERSKYVQGYEGYMDNIDADDYATGSQYVSTRTDVAMDDARWGLSNNMYDESKLFGDFLYDYINRNEDALNVAKVNDTVTDAYLLGFDKGFLQTMSDEEIGVYNYLYKTQGQESANAYLSYIESDLEGRRRSQEQARWASYAKESPVGSSVFSTLISPMKGLSYLGQAADMLDDGKMDQDAGYNRFSYIPSTIRSQVSTTIENSGKWGKVGSFAYNTGMSMADFLFTTAVSGGNQALSLGIMGSGAAADATLAAKDRGLEDGEAFALGTIAGIAEIAMEKISLGAWLEGDMSEGALKYLLKNALSEGGEEAGTSVVNLLADIMIAGDKSEWNMAIQAYMDEGKTPEEAFGLVLAEQAAQIGLDALGGILSGAAIGGGTYAGASVGAKFKYGSTAKDTAKSQQLVADGLELNPDNQYIQKMQTKLDKGKKLSGMQVRNILAANQEKITENDLKKIQKAAEKRLTDLGQTKDVAEVAEIATKWATGQDLTSAEKKLLTHSQYGSRVANELLPENIASGDYSTEWAEDIGTKKINATAYNIKSIIDKIAKMDNPATYKSLEERVGEEEKLSVSKSGKATIRSTGEAIDLSKVEVADFITDKKTGKITDMTLKADGKEVKASEIDYADDNQSYLFSAVKNIENITPGDATAFIRDYDPSSGQTVGEYLNGIDEAFTYGYHQYSEADMGAGLFTPKLSKEQAKGAYLLGQTSRSKADANKSIAIKRMRTAVEAETAKATAEGKAAPKSKKLTITYNEGGKIVDFEKAGLELTEKQEAGLTIAKFLHKLGLGTNFEFFASRESQTMVDKKTGKPIRVTINEQGVEEAAPAGVYRKADGTIRIDLNAYNGRGLALYSLAHELTHFIQKWSDEKYKVLADFLVKTYEKTDMTMHQRVLSEQARLEDIRGKEVSYNEAYDEVVAKAMMKMFDDGKLVERLTELKAKDQKLAQKLWEGFKKFLDKFFGVYNSDDRLYKDSDDLVKMKDAFEQLQNLFAEALVEASENFQTYLIAKEAGLDFMPVEDGVQYSYNSLAEAAGFVAVENEDGTRSFTRDGKKVSKVTIEDIDNSPIGAFINFSLEMGDINEADAKRQKEMFAKICTMACKTNDFAMTMQFVGSAVFTGMKANADKQYGTTYDFPSICTKTQAVIDAMSAKMVSLGRGLTTDEIVQLYEDVFASGNPVPCPECYVFSRWIGIGGLLDNIKKYQDYYGDMDVKDVAAAYLEMKAKVSKFAEEQGISFGKAKGALTAKLTKEFNKLTEKIEKQQNQGEKVKASDKQRLAELEPMMNTVKAMTWLENVYFADSSLKKVNPNFRVPDSVLFDLNNGEAFATKYKEAWAFRTTQGAGYGKAITPYAEARLGEGILVTNNTTNAIKGRAQGSLNNYFLNQKGKLDKQSRDALKRARMKQKIQAFLGGQRFQSTSDARYENASDYLLAALEMQAMAGMVQCYTKVDGAVPAFSAWGFSINQSLMPLNGGLDADGNVKDTPVGGMKPSVAFENRNKHETAGTITIGVNDNHIRAMFKQWVRDFIIPYHASGGKADVVAEFRRIQEGKEEKGEAVRSTDYSRTQSDKILSDDVLRWQGKTDAQIQRIHEIRNARIAILTRGKPNMTVVRSNRFLSALYDKFNGGEWDGVKVAKSKVESQIFPNEFWDQTVTYDESAKITKDYLEYCEDLGFLHRFSGMIPSNGMLVPAKGYNENGERVQLTDLAYKYDEKGNKTTEVEEFFWKVLTDRRMYDNNGNYLAQKIVTLNDTTTDTVTGFAKHNQGREYDKAKAEALAKKYTNGEQYSSQETDADKNKNRASNGSPLTRRSVKQRSVGSTHIKMPSTAAARILGIENIANYSESVNTAIAALGELYVSVDEKKPVLGFRRPVSASSLEGALVTLGVLKRGGTSGSAYRYENGHALRISNHSAKAENFKGDGEHLSLVLYEKGKLNDFEEAKNNVIEAVFKYHYLDRNPEAFKRLIHDIAHFIVKGEYHDTAGAMRYNFSGTKAFKKSAEQRMARDGVAREQQGEVYSSQETDADNAPTFYSHMAKVVDGMKQEKFGASSVISMLIDKKRGVKAEEIRWSGIQAFLDGKKSVTKADLLDFINSSMLHIEEETRSSIDNVTKEFVQAWRNFIDPDLDESEILDGLNYVDTSLQAHLEGLVEDGDLDQYYADYILDLAKRANKHTGEPTKWDEYKLDGGSNYRELIFKMPGTTYTNMAMQGHWGVEAQGVLAHARMQDFDTADGKMMLFIEEIQSDWHNQGHKEGYRKEGEKTERMLRAESKKAYEEFYAAVEKMLEDNADWEDDNAIYYAHPVVVAEMFDGNESHFEALKFTDEQKETIRAMVAEESARQEALKTAPKQDMAPDAPFKENYHEFVLKRLLRMAAEEGYDSIGWTTADLQMDRWNPDRRTNESMGVKDAKNPDAIAFELAYQNLYDRNMRKFLEKYGKQWGAEVGKTALDNGTEVWSMDITDAMKKSVLKEGQAMYSSQETDLDSDGKKLSKDQAEFFAYSVVRGKDGKLLVVYHGGTVENQFDTSRGANGATQYGPGAYFTDSEYYAKEYTYYRGGEVKPYYLNIERLFDDTDMGATAQMPEWKKLEQILRDNGIEEKFIKRFADGGFAYMSRYLALKSGAKTSDSWAGSDRLNAMLREAGYQGIKGVFNDMHQYVVFDPEQAKFTSNKQPTTNPDMRFSTQETDNISNRDLLANAFEGLSQNSDEYKMIQEYKGHIKLLNEYEEKLDKLNAEIRKITFDTEGKRDSKKLKELQDEAKKVAANINRHDKKLISMEASGPLRKVIEFERKKAAQKTRDHVKEIQKNKKTRAEQTELRHKIRKAVRDLDKLLNRGNKKMNVKEDMKGFVSKALELADYIFTDHISNEELIRRGITVRMTPIEAALVKETEDIISQLYDNADNLTDEEFTELDAKRKSNLDKLRDLLTAQRNESLNIPVYNLFNDLVTEYASLKNSKQDSVKAAYNEELENSLRAFMSDDDRVKILKNMRVADMTTEELNWLYRAYTMVLTNVRNANKFHVNGMNATIEQVVGQISIDFGSRKIPEKKMAIAMQKLVNKFGWDYEKLYYALDRIGSEAFTKLIMNIADSENTVMQDIMEAVAFRDEMVKNYGFNNWDVNKEIDREFLDNTGKKFKLTLGQMMSLYAYSRREGAWDHIEYGGFVFGEAALTNPKPADSYKLSKDQCEAITNLLTKEQKGYVEDMQKFLSKTMGEKGNEVSMLLYGIKMFGEENYFPIHIAGQYKAQANESQAKAAAGFQSMSNAGFTHAQNPNAKAPFVLEGFNEVWADHVNEMSRYHGTVPALEDLRRVMNRSTYSDSVAESQSIKQLMENHYGKEAVDYFDNLYREANSGAITDKLQKKSHKLLSLFRKNSVAYSLSVLIQQPASLVRAYDLIDRKYFGYKGFGAITSGIAKAVSDKWTKAHTNAYNEMLKYAPGVTMAKEIGGFDTHTGGSIRSYLLDTNKSLKQKWKTGTAMEKGKAVLDVVDDNAIANLPNVADKIAWIEIWNACKRETVATHKDLAVNSEEFMKAVGDRFTEVIRATQVYDSMFAKSPMLKSKNLAVQYLVSFMNEPNTVANMAEKAVRDATRGNWKKGARTAAVLVHSIIFTNVLKSIVYAMRDDDEDETYIEKYIEAVTGNMMDDFNALNYIPLVRDVWSIAQGYDVERADMAIVADALDSLDQVIKNAVKDTDNMTEEELIEFDKKVTDANWKLVESVASFFGIPVKNIRREIEGVLDHARIASANAGQATAKSTWDKIQDAVVDSIPFMQNKNTKQDKLYDAIVSGDKAYIGRLKSTYKTEDAYNNAVRKALRENDPRIQAAAQARYDGNTEEYKRIFREIKNEGKFSFDDIMSAINSELSKLTPDKVTSDYTASGYVEAIIMGNMSNATAMKDDIIATKVANGKTQAEAEREFASNVATGIRDAYTSGLLDDAGAKKMLMEYADKDEEEAASKVSYWSFNAKHPQYDLTESNVNDYIEFAEPANIPLDVFVQYVEGTKGLSDIKDEWGDIEVSKRDQVLEVINSLPITWQQKDALYLAAGYAESKIWDVPW